ncbi:MAG: hypothetical protein LC799_16415, partial [Actinobacteria bacterium]|nr:hypothetical protein [Actinomycetota bacterium]
PAIVSIVDILSGASPLMVDVRQTGSGPARIRGRRGPKKAAVAVGHSILVIAWHLLSTGETYTDLGGDYFDKRRTSTHQRRLVAQLEAMGHRVTLEPAA